MYAAVTTGALQGFHCFLAQVEVDCSRGLPGFEMVGLLGSEVKEARERIRVALRNAGVELPPMRITVNISPASLHKEGTSYDLPVAVGILAAQGLIPQEYVEKTLIAGELSLNGEVRPVCGILPMALEAGKRGIRRCLVPVQNVEEAALTAEMECIGIHRLEEAGMLLAGRDGRDTGLQKRAVPGSLRGGRGGWEGDASPDFGEVRGQEGAKRAALAAAAGAHHMLMVGPPGAGKSMIARAIPGILPPLSREEMLETASVYSVAGMMPESLLREGRRPFVSPHHTLTGHALTGGGRIPKPGAVSLAHKGILFLDELTEFGRGTLDLLRQPLEEKRVCLARTSGSYIYPADFMLVGAMNPCPCGYYPDKNRCRCTSSQVRRYLERVSGPILDRMDICTEVVRVPFGELMGPGTRQEADSCGGRRAKNGGPACVAEGLEEAGAGMAGMDSRRMREAVMEARERQERRLAGTGLRCNAQMGPAQLKEFCVLGMKEQDYLEELFRLLHLTARSCHRLLRVARTLADLEGAQRIGRLHLSEAACYRMADGKYWSKEG